MLSAPSRLFVTLILLSQALGGCAVPNGTMYTSKFMTKHDKAKYSEIVREFESKRLDLSTMRPGDLFVLCSSLKETNQFDKAFECFERYRGRVEVGEFNFGGIGDSRAYERVWYGQAKLALGDAHAAIEAANEAEQTRIAADNAYMGITLVLEIEIRRLLGAAYLSVGQHDRVREEIRHLEAFDTGRFITQLLTTQKHASLAALKFGLGDYEGALVDARTRKSLLMRRWDGNNLIQYAMPSKYIEARALLETGRVLEARKKYDALFRKGQISKIGRIHWVALYDRARIAALDGDPLHAISLLRQSVEVLESQRSTIGGESSKIGFAGDTQKVYAELVGHLAAAGAAAEAFTYAERGKARALIDVLAAKRQFAGGSASGNLEVAQLMAEIDASERDNPSLDSLNPALKETNTRGIALQKKAVLQKKAPELASLVTVLPLSVSELQKFLRPNELLIEYFGSKDQLFVFAVDHRSVRAHPIKAGDLEERVRAFRDAITSRDDQTTMSLAQSLHKTLIRPLGKSVAESDLIIVPHGALHYLPFNALHDGERFMIDAATLRILPSASVLQFLSPRSTERPRRMIAFGNPDLDDPSFDLPGAEKEVDAIASRSPGIEVWMRSEATESRLKKRGQAFDVLHFAMHGTFDATDPLKSGLLMAADAENDGVLTVGELYDLSLPADLVTLSACETAMGKVANGDDVVGFTRGFLYAGAQSIVSSLWKVDDEATYHLMKAFYQNLESQDKQTALRSAQLSVKRQYGRSPVYWAAFQITGAGH